MNEKYRLIFADDEQHSRDGISLLLEQRDDIEVVSACQNGKEAVEQILKDRPAIVLLDIQMPGFDGFNVLEAVYHHYKPAVIFITAFDRYALKAFDYYAVDYLLKPYSPERFHSALNRTVKSLNEQKMSELTDRIITLLESRNQPSTKNSEQSERSNNAPRKLLVDEGSRMVLLEIERILYVSGAGPYIEIHTAKKEYLHRETMQNFENNFATDQYFRIHKSTLVNLEHVTGIETSNQDSYAVIGQTKLKISRRKKKEFLEKLNHL